MAVILTVPEKVGFQVKTPVSQLITPAALVSISHVTLLPAPGSESNSVVLLPPGQPGKSLPPLIKISVGVAVLL